MTGKVRNIKVNFRDAAVAQWICLRLPSCCPWFEYQANHLHFFQFLLISLHDPRVHVAVRRRGGRGWRTVRKVHAEVLQGARPQQHLSGRKRAHHLQQSKVRQLKGAGWWWSELKVA